MTAKTPKAPARRQFLADTARMACGVGLLGLGLGLYAQHATALAAAALRPPGALPEDGFPRRLHPLRHVRARLPLQHPALAKPEDAVSHRHALLRRAPVPCEMCEDIPCVKACPTGALDHSLTDINKSKMGLGGAGRSRNLPELPRPALRHLLSRLPGDRQGHHARSADQCAHRQAHACSFRWCIRSTARVAASARRPARRKIAAIKVFPLYMAKGELRQHYRLGWVEKEKAGRQPGRRAKMIEHQTACRKAKCEHGHYDPASGHPESMRGMAGSERRVIPASLPKAFREASYERDCRQTTLGAEAIAEKGWLAAHKWLMLRRTSQIGILLLFLVGPLVRAVDRQGQSQLQLHAGLPAADRSLCAAAVAADAADAGEAGADRRRSSCCFYLLVGGRIYCSWVCPVNLVTDSADWLRARLGIKGGAACRADALLDSGHDAALLGTDRHDRLGNGQSGVDAASRPDLRPGFGLDGDPRGVPVRPVRDAPRLVRPSLPGRRLLQPDRQVESAARSAAGRDACNDCMDCFAVCPEPQVIRPALKAIKGTAPVILEANCTNCGRCIDVCSKDVFSFGLRFNNQVSAAPLAKAQPEK